MSLSPSRAALRFAACIVVASMLPVCAAHAAPPEIRTSAQNTVPACVTPDRLMAFLKTRNGRLDPRYAEIAAWYRHHGQAWHVRWDYAFFQMALETNFLTYRRGNGKWGDVDPRQNNFAGLGTTGGGVPGDSYPDVGTGVLAQIQHLVVYSGQHIDRPVGARTRLKQNDIIENVARFKGRTTFADLARRWAADRHYGKSIEWVASRYRATYCTGKYARRRAAAPPVRPAAPHLVRDGRSGLGGVIQVADASPVRTIWSRSTQGSAPAQAPAEKAQQQPARAVPETPVRAQRPPAPAATTPAPATVSVPAPATAAAAADPRAVVAPSSIATQSLVVTTQSEIAAPTPSAAAPAPALDGTAQPDTTASVAVPAAQEQPGAFAFAAAMTATMQPNPVPRPVAVAGTGTSGCNVMQASYGGEKTLLVRAEAGGQVRYTALTVLEGFEGAMLQSFTKAHAPGGMSVGTFATKDAALARARELCSGAALAPHTRRAHAG
jgi:hypothetical protein